MAYTGGPPDSRDDKIAVPDGLPTILRVDGHARLLPCDEILPDGSWRMAWHGLRTSDR